MVLKNCDALDSYELTDVQKKVYMYIYYISKYPDNA